ncbi:MAG: TIGR04442 family protein [Desulfuromonadales bacterium]|nr:TIGR04442 family protein [Desulfuromonadales bacterium]
MKTELRLHGYINSRVEYYATAVGCRLDHHHFYAIEDRKVRFFSPGNELVLTPDRISRRGTGATLCEYMFGDELPAADLTRDGVVNRLTIPGAAINDNGRLTFTDYNQTTLDYNEVFHQGHAIHNYFFFLHGLDGDSVRARQETLLRLLGKTLKRLPEPGQCEDSRLASRILALLPPECSLYLVRLSHAHNRHYQQENRNLYYPQRDMAAISSKALDELAENLDIPPRQRERIRLDVIYRHRDNYRIADSYRKLLLSCANQGRISSAQQQQLSRIKTMALRCEIPEILLSTLDRCSAGRLYSASPEPHYLSTTRHFLNQLPARQPLDNGQMAQLLLCRSQAHDRHDNSVDRLIEEYRSAIKGSHCFNYLYHLLDDLDTTTTAINRILFLDNHLPGEFIILQLLHRYRQFNKIAAGLFEQLFLNDQKKNRYLGHFGRLKLSRLKQGISAVAAGNMRPKKLHEELHYISGEEQQVRSILAAARDWLKANPIDIFSNQDQDVLYEALNNELHSTSMFSIRLNQQLFLKIIHDLQMEHLYLQQLLPDIIATANQALREDFFSNSGLDYFQIEEIETRYAKDNNVDPETLQRLQCHF